MSVSKEELIELYINQNLPRFEVAEALKIPENKIKRYLAKYGIKKSRELYKASCSRIAKQKGGHTAGKKWYNNGVIQTCAETCPDGFVEGRLEETKNKQSEALKGHSVSEETKDKLRNIFTGCTLSEEHKKKISNYMSKNHPMKGKHHTQEAKEKIKQARAKQIMKTPISDKFTNFASSHDLKQYLSPGLVIDFDKLSKDIGENDTAPFRFYVYKMYRDNQIVFSFGSNHAAENKIKKWIDEIYDGVVIQGSRKIINGYEIDLFFPEINVAIEYNGCYWHSANKKGLPNNYHQVKSKLCKEKSIRLIHIWEDQWKDKRLNPILKGIIKAALKIKDDKKPIYARKCELKEIDAATYKSYCDAHHTQKSRPAKVMLGLYYENELVQVASFSPCNSRNGRKMNESKYEWEWVRGCEDFNHSRVIGGVSKLFSYFVKKYSPKSVLCYSDFNLFFGNGYASCGFEFDGFTGPDKFYIDEFGNRVNRNASKYKEYMKKVKDGDWLVCYGAGNLRFVWKGKKD